MKLSIIIPTLNEEQTIVNLLRSLGSQNYSDFEVIVVDGGSKDKTVEVARKYGANVMIYDGLSEFASRNVGARIAKGDILVFTSADTIFPSHLLEDIKINFEKDPQLIALSGPGIPYDASFPGKILYGVYNFSRYLFARLPKPFQRFSTSTNFLAVRKSVFEKTGGFDPTDINADGIMGSKLSKMGKVNFNLNTHVYISARRIKRMGLFKFILHYLYVLENFFPFLSHTSIIRGFKKVSKSTHRKLHYS